MMFWGVFIILIIGITAASIYSNEQRKQGIAICEVTKAGTCEYFRCMADIKVLSSEESANFLMKEQNCILNKMKSNNP